MYKITVNDKKVLRIEADKSGSFLVNDKEVAPDIIEIKHGIFHVIMNHQSYTAEVVKHDYAEKLFYIRVNNNTYKVQARDKYDELLKELGLDAMQSKKSGDLKAPMPGLVVEVSVTEGQEVKQGDKLVVLEAMKMENVLKAQADGIVKKVNAKKGNTVEKNEVLVLFA